MPTKNKNVVKSINRMENEQLSTKVDQLLQEVTNMSPIEPSDDWEAVFNQKLQRSKMAHPRKLSGVRLVLILVVLVNVGLCTTLLFKDINPLGNRHDQLKTISKELLINPISASI